MMSLILTVILTSLVVFGFFLDSLLERLLGKIEGDFLTALIMAWKAEIVVDAAFDRLLSNLLLVKNCELECLGSDLNPVEEHECEMSLRKSLSILGLTIPSIGQRFACCTLVFEYEILLIEAMVKMYFYVVQQCSMN